MSGKDNIEIEIPIASSYEGEVLDAFYGLLESYEYDDDFDEGVKREIVDAVENDCANGFRLYADAYAKDWVKEVSALLDVPLTGEDIGTSHLYMPREYNFCGDQLFITVPEKFVVSMYRKVDREVLKRLIRERCTSRSGFISFYSPNSTDKVWTRVPSKWDVAQTGILSIAVELTFREACSGNNQWKGSLEEEFFEYCSGNGKFEDFLLTARSARLAKQEGKV